MGAYSVMTSEIVARTRCKPRDFRDLNPTSCICEEKCVPDDDGYSQ
jgi:hypothetical protein